MKSFILIFITSVLFLGNNYAQQTDPDKDRFFFGWEVSFPSNDFLSETSYSGWRFGYQHNVKTNLSVGLATSWNSFQEYIPRTTYQKPDGTGALTTDLVRELYSVPITLNAQYYLEAGKKIIPYVGLGLGTQWTQQTIYFNIYSIEDENWGFAARPEIGMLYSLSRYSELYLSATYNYASNKSDLFDVEGLSHFGLSIGIVF